MIRNARIFRGVFSFLLLRDTEWINHQFLVCVNNEIYDHLLAEFAFRCE